MHLATFRRLACAQALAALLPAAHADDHGPGRTWAPAPPVVQQECGSCHLAYPAQLLPAASWQQLLARLPQHFGSDASLDAAPLREITRWLVGQAGSGRRTLEAPPEGRITRAAWFLREHRALRADTWKRPAILTPANCSACHAGAAQGDFDEHAVHIPR